MVQFNFFQFNFIYTALNHNKLSQSTSESIGSGGNMEEMKIIIHLLLYCVCASFHIPGNSVWR